VMPGMEGGAISCRCGATAAAAAATRPAEPCCT
jgi:hypothetical protein